MTRIGVGNLGSGLDSTPGNTRAGQGAKYARSLPAGTLTIEEGGGLAEPLPAEGPLSSIFNFLCLASFVATLAMSLLLPIPRETLS